MRNDDLFSPVVAEHLQHELFRDLNKSAAHSGCRRLMNEVFNDMPKPDNHFIEQFQTQGFEARVFELGMFAALKECGLIIRQDYERPDFIVSNGKLEVCIEVTTSNPPSHLKLQNLSKEIHKIDPEKIDEGLMEKLTDELPIRFGSPLFSKLNKRYWELEQCLDKPLVFAIQACHEQMVSQFPVMPLISYLYGLRSYPEWTENGRILKHSKIDQHKKDEKIIPSGFFNQPNSNYVSGIIFSNQLTVSKFVRMAYQKGYGLKNLKIIRTGFASIPNVSQPVKFQYQLGTKEAIWETWCQGLSFIVNPNAEEPVPPFYTGKMTNHIYWDGDIKSAEHDFHPLNSQSIIIVTE